MRDERMSLGTKILVVILFIALVGCVISQAVQRESKQTVVWTEDG